MGALLEFERARLDPPNVSREANSLLA